MPTPNGKIKVCKLCDLAVEIEPPEKGEVVVCPWCMAPMARHHRHPFELSLSLALAALVPFAIVLAYPFLSLSIAGLRESSTVFEISSTLWKKGFPSLGVVVFWMSIGLPLIRLLAYIYVLAPLRHGGRAPYAWLVFRTAEMITPWAMLDVFLIGVLVAVVKLRDLASVEPGVGLAAFVVLMLLAIGSSATLDREAVWDRIGRGAA
jgi:paraquat-inducible protein A